ncbi:MAG TPA: helix-turn-helix domain-containing protein [Anditalea sp.]|nr:helix-turn-helix domain-containing protein [Anditalea sp.]
MFIQFYQPHPKLRGFVSNLMVYNAELDKDISPTSAVHPPIPEHSLYFYPHDPCISLNQHTGIRQINAPSIIVGPFTERVNITIGHQNLVIRVGLYPGALHRLLGISVYELFNKTYSSVDLIGLEIAQVNEQLQNTDNYGKMKDVVEAFLLKKVDKMRSLENFDNAIYHAFCTNEIMTVEALASKACLSFRQLERKCKERIGLPPKLYLRVVRFSNAYRMHERYPDFSWTQIAHASGYFDQAHLIRDFKEFAGVIPTFIDEELGRTSIRLQGMLPF